jgi:hypothetical protein
MPARPRQNALVRCGRALSTLVVAALALSAPSSSARANGRMPGANDVLFDVRDPDHWLLRASFGLVQSFDAGASWQWICEQAIDSSGVIADPPLAIVEDGSLVLLPPTGSALISRDRGCSWARSQGLWSGAQGVDLTAHPSDKRQLFALVSKVSGVDAGVVTYDNRLLLTRDDAASWQLLASLPDDFAAETLEVAKSDPQRIYVSGTDSRDPRLGVLFVSEDGGAHFTKRTLALPAGTGSMLISAIHPQNPDLVWLRVPARGDTIGILPARLYLTSDKGQSFRMLAATQRAMFGFALSPDGAELAYGGPSDGLYVGPSDGSGSFQKRGSWGVRCLRWSEDGALYMCGSEPSDAFTLALSDDRGATFRSLYRLADTCPGECAAESQFAQSCQSAWTPLRPQLRATGEMCSVPWARPAEDAGSEPEPLDAGEAEPAPVDPGTEELDAGAEQEHEEGDGGLEPSRPGRGAGCGCGLAGALREDQRFAWLAALLALGLMRRRVQGARHLGTQQCALRRSGSDRRR